MTLVIDPKAALLKGVDPVQFCVFLTCPLPYDLCVLKNIRKRQIKAVYGKRR